MRDPSEPSRPLSVTQAIRLYRAGNIEAFEALVERYQPQMERYLSRRLGRHRGGLNTAEDLAQSVFRNLDRHMRTDRTWIRSMTNTEDFEKVLFHLASGRVIHAIQYEESLCRGGAGRRAATAVGSTGVPARRRTLRDQDVELPDGLSLTASLADDSTGPDETVELALTLQEMKDRVSRYHLRWAEILELRIQGYTLDEIAPRVGISRRHLDRAMEEVRDILREWSAEVWGALEDEHDA